MGGAGLFFYHNEHYSGSMSSSSGMRLVKADEIFAISWKIFAVFCCEASDKADAALIRS